MYGFLNMKDWMFQGDWQSFVVSHWWFGPVFLLFGIWSLVWKGLGLWRAAQNKQKYWFVAILILNTIGVLEILYLFVFSKKFRTLHKPHEF